MNDSRVRNCKQFSTIRTHDRKGKRPRAELNCNTNARTQTTTKQIRRSVSRQRLPFEATLTEHVAADGANRIVVQPHAQTALEVLQVDLVAGLICAENLRRRGGGGQGGLRWQVEDVQHCCVVERKLVRKPH